MNKLHKSVVNFALVAVMLFAFNIVAMAQGTTTINVSKNSAAVGDSITVSISATESGTITVKYTASMLTLSSCSVSGYTSEGNAVSFSGKAGDIVFSAASEGTASIIVSSTANSGSSTTLTIGGSSASTETTTSTSTTEETAATEESEEETTDSEETTTEDTAETTSATANVGTLNSDGGFDINGVSYVVSERFSDSEMPSGFSKTTVTIGSSTYSEPSNGSITLLYLKPADNTSGSGVFYLYNAEAGTVAPFLMLGSSDKYVIISDAGSAPSTAFTATTIEVNGGSATAYTVDGSEFFYVYGVNQDGAAGWFVYDSTYGTVSRMDESVLSASSTEETEEVDTSANTSDNSLYIEKLNLYRKIIMGLIILCVILLFIIINKAIRNHGDDDDFDGDVFAKAPAKSSKRLPRSIVFGGRERDDEDGEEDEEDDEEDYIDEDDIEDDEDDEEYYDDEDYSKSNYESESYEARRASSLNMMDLNDL